MSADLARYIRSSLSAKGPTSGVPSQRDTDSIDTSELLSEGSSDVSEILEKRRIRPGRAAAAAKRGKALRSGSGRRAKPTLIPVEEEDESMEIVYKLSDYLPRAASEVLAYKPAQPSQVRLKPEKRRIDTRGERDSSSTVSSLDTEALLRLSDEDVDGEEEEEQQIVYSLPRKPAVASSKWTPSGPHTGKKDSDSRSSPGLNPSKSSILDAIRNKSKAVADHPKPPKKDYRPPSAGFNPPPRRDPKLQRDASEPNFHTYTRGVGESYQRENPGTYSAREWSGAGSRYSPSVRDVQAASIHSVSQSKDGNAYQAKSSKSPALSYNTQQTSILPQSRLQLSSVCQISIPPKVSQKSPSDFSLLEQFQSQQPRKSDPRSPSHPNTSLAASLSYTGELLLGSDAGQWRKSIDSNKEEKAKLLQVCTCILAGELKRHLPDCRATTVAAIIPHEPEDVSLPFKPSPKRSPQCKKPSISIIEATVRIQRAFRRHLYKQAPPIKTFQTWSSDNRSLQYQQTTRRKPVELPDPERATTSLYNALDQLRVLKNLASNTSSEETSFVLSESVMSREVTPGGKGDVLQPIERQVTPTQKEEEPVDIPENSPSLPPKDEFLEASIDTDLLLRSTESFEF